MNFVNKNTDAKILLNFSEYFFCNWPLLEKNKFFYFTDRRKFFNDLICNTFENLLIINVLNINVDNVIHYNWFGKKSIREKLVISLNKSISISNLGWLESLILDILKVNNYPIDKFFTLLFNRLNENGKNLDINFININLKNIIKNQIGGFLQLIEKKGLIFKNYDISINCKEFDTFNENIKLIYIMRSSFVENIIFYRNLINIIENQTNKQFSD